MFKSVCFISHLIWLILTNQEVSKDENVKIVVRIMYKENSNNGICWSNWY